MSWTRATTANISRATNNADNRVIKMYEDSNPTSSLKMAIVESIKAELNKLVRSMNERGFTNIQLKEKKGTGQFVIEFNMPPPDTNIRGHITYHLTHNSPGEKTETGSFHIVLYLPDPKPSAAASGGGGGGGGPVYGSSPVYGSGPVYGSSEAVSNRWAFAVSSARASPSPASMVKGSPKVWTSAAISKDIKQVYYRLQGVIEGNMLKFQDIAYKPTLEKVYGGGKPLPGNLQAKVTSIISLMNEFPIPLVNPSRLHRNEAGGGPVSSSPGQKTSLSANAEVFTPKGAQYNWMGGGPYNGRGGRYRCTRTKRNKKYTTKKLRRRQTHRKSN